MGPDSQRLRSAIQDAVSAAPDGAAFRQEVLDVVHRHIPFDAACLAGTDPAAVVPTSLTTVGYDDPRLYATVVDIEYGDGEEPGRFESMLRRHVPIRTLREATGGDVRRSRVHADVLAPYGLHDEVRMLFRTREGSCWGMCTLSRGAGREFTDAEIAVLGMALTDIGDGLRAVVFRDSVEALPSAPEGPAIAVLEADNTVTTVTSAALDYFDRLGWNAPDCPPRLVWPAVIAGSLRRSGQDSVVVRARTRDGEWVVVRAGPFGSDGPRRRIAMTVEPARPPEIAALMAAAHGLTPRESEVLAHVLTGASREAIGRALFISPYTVQDHLKNIFAKTGVRSRRSLVARVVDTEYLPRLGTPVAPDGWFAPASQPPAPRDRAAP
jgi:DNA-binding CsgD family transcriptional regulator